MGLVWLVSRAGLGPGLVDGGHAVTSAAIAKPPDGGQVMRQKQPGSTSS
jgi:hypothetical protein